MSFDDFITCAMIAGGILLAIWTILLFLYTAHLSYMRRLLEEERANYRMWRRFERLEDKQRHHWN